MKKLIIVESSDLLRKVLGLMLSEIAGLSLVGQFDGTAPALSAIRHNPPDIVLLDAHLNKGRSIDIVRTIACHFPQIRVIVTSNFANPICKRVFTEAGAYAFYDKNSEMEAVLSSVEHLTCMPENRRFLNTPQSMHR